MREVMSVILHAQALAALKNGAGLEIECVEDVENDKGPFRGGWRVYVREQGVLRVLVIGRSIEVRLIKTVSGLLGLAQEQQLRSVSIPMFAGERVVWIEERRDEGFKG